MGSQTCLSGRKAGEESDNHKSPVQKLLSMLKGKKQNEKKIFKKQNNLVLSF